jgi:hypothetical protein
VTYDPVTDVLTGVATITAQATQNLSAFNLDLDEPLSVSAVTVNGADAEWSHVDDELTITPSTGIRNSTRFVTVIAYAGIPETLPDFSGFIHTDDGALVVGQPHVADTWFPANDHPSDRAAFKFRVTVPAGLEVVANGFFEKQTTSGAWTTWVWNAPDPMAAYLAGMAIGELAINAYRIDRIRYWDAIDPDLLPRVGPHTGTHFALAQQADSSYKRITREIAVPTEGATLSFWVNRDTEPFFDFFMVEARTAGGDDWTTLPVPEITTQDVSFLCDVQLAIHPFLAHYLTVLEPPDEFTPPTCDPTGSIGTPPGQWWAATGSSFGWEEWTVDLSGYAESTVEVSLTYVSDDIIQLGGVFIDDIVVSTGEGTTSFEPGEDPANGGWQVPGAPPADSPGNLNDWIVGTIDDAPPSLGEVANASLAKQDEIIGFLEGMFGTYPFRAAGGIVDDAEIGFALENQTRPIYSKFFFTDPLQGDLVVVHELAHQWFGDSLTIEQWQHIWLNEGFATYAEWLWLEHIGFDTVQGTFDFFYNAIPADAVDFWGVTIGDPGPDQLFNFAVYARGAMTLHQLRLEIGDDAFFKLLNRWARSQGGNTVSTDEFIALAEEISRQQLDDLFNTWLFTAEKPVVESAGVSDLRVGAGSTRADPRLRLLDQTPRK